MADVDRRPVVAVAATRRPPGFAGLLAALGSWCRPVALTEAGGPTPPGGAARGAGAAARRATDPAAADRARAVLERGGGRRAGGVPAAVWADTGAEHAAAVSAGAAAVLVAAPAGFAEADDPLTVRVPEQAGVSGAALLAPFVRERLRRARGLPSAPVAVERADGWWWPGAAAPLAEAAAVTAVACCAAAFAASAEGVRRAAAFGTPTVCGPEPARAFGALPGRDVVVGADRGTDPDAGAERAAALASDPRACARLSRSLYERYRERCEPAEVAARLALHLFPTAAGPGPAADRVLLHLTELRTPRDAPVRARIAAGLAGLPTR